MERETRRKLLFDEQGEICGRINLREGKTEQVREAGASEALGFCGIHIISPEIFRKMEGEGAFSIIDSYLKLASQGERICAYRVDGCNWRDLGKPESIRQTAEEMLRLRN
jgi:NDP-sugar pyrophosphorylase family protein